jgi:hypothetical protein
MGAFVRILVLSIALLANGAAFAQPAITLQPELGENSLRAERVNNVTGSCGGRQVRVLGFQDSKGDYFRTDVHSGKISIGRPEGKPSSLIIGSDINAPEVFEGHKVVPFLILLKSRCYARLHCESRSKGKEYWAGLPRPPDER